MEEEDEEEEEGNDKGKGAEKHRLTYLNKGYFYGEPRHR